MLNVLSKISYLDLIKKNLLFLVNYSKNHEIHKTYGKQNPTTTYYVIRNYTKEAGWGSILNYVCLQIGYALDNGYIPVIDMMNYPNAYLKKSELHKINAWEKYAEIYSNNIKLLSNVSELIASEINRVTDNHRLKVLGILCRGTDYTNLKPLYHVIPFSAAETINEVRKIIDNYDRIYLATEDQMVFDTFMNELPKEKLFYTEQYRFRADKVTGYLSETAEALNLDEYQKGVRLFKNTVHTGKLRFIYRCRLWWILCFYTNKQR